MDRHTCKLCFRRFHNGRALGGHMRSHVMAASAAAFHSPLLSRQPQSPPLSLASSSSTEIDDDKPAAQQEPPTPCVVREGTKKRFHDSPGLSSGGRAVVGESSVVQDWESDTESSSPRFAVSRRRSKRVRRRRAPPPPVAVAVASSDPEQPAKSGVSDATTEEDVAMSLVMLSRDSWTRSSSFVGVGADDADHQEHDDVALPPRGGGRHQCGVCRKVFRSYQALGGHRASIKKGKGGCVHLPSPPPATPSSSKAARRAEKNGPAPAVHECPFCFRVFESGQALGGHKRAHMSYAAAATGAPAAPPPIPSPQTPAAKCGDSSGSFDLNVPAAATTDDDFELSAVYDTEFGRRQTVRSPAADGPIDTYYYARSQTPT